MRNEISLEPRIFCQPWLIARRRVRQRKKARREIIAPRFHGPGECRLAAAAEIPGLCIVADQHRQTDAGQKLREPAVPQRRAFGPRRIVARTGLARVAEPHRNDCDAGWIIEGSGGKAQPVAQTLARRVVPGDARFVHLAPRRLPDDAKTRRRTRLHDRARTMGKLRGAALARAYIAENLRKNVGHRARPKPSAVASGSPPLRRAVRATALPSTSSSLPNRPQ